MPLDSQMIILFGATGDLARRKLYPALYRLHAKGELTSCTPIIGTGRKPFSREEFIASLKLKEVIKDADPRLLSSFEHRIEYLPFDLATTTPLEFKTLVKDVQRHHGCTDNLLFYLSISPELFDPVVELLKPLAEEHANLKWRRVVFEKPFGYDLESAVALNASIMRVFSEEQVFRIDHYLGKELVQNILAIRFANPLFTSIWTSEAIKRIEITVEESLGVETRSGYYDGSGAIRDMLQNHLLQVLSLTAMEPPISLQAEDIRDKAVEVIRNLAPLAKDDIILGQYGEGELNGAALPSYREEPGIPRDSTTETYLSTRLFINTPRWNGVPFILTTGKRLAKRQAHIKVILKKDDTLFPEHQQSPNIITIRIQPDEGVAVSFNAKKPGRGLKLVDVTMDFCHPCHFGPNTPEAYESLLQHIMMGDRTLFTRWDWLAESWRFIDRLRQLAPLPLPYASGSDGPVAAKAFIDDD